MPSQCASRTVLPAIGGTGAGAVEIADLLPHLRGVVMERVECTADGLVISARWQPVRAACPGCGAWSLRVHSGYVRRLHDTPAGGRPVLIRLGLLLLDLDHFKQINDQRGHLVGDHVLANVGAVLRSVLRARDFAGRNGGEEFAILLPDTEVPRPWRLPSVSVRRWPRFPSRAPTCRSRPRSAWAASRITRRRWTGSSGSPTRRSTLPNGTAETLSSWPTRPPRRPLPSCPGGIRTARYQHPRRVASEVTSGN